MDGAGAAKIMFPFFGGKGERMVKMCMLTCFFCFEHVD